MQEGLFAMVLAGVRMFSLPGVEKPMPIGQGGHVIINGAPGKVTFNLVKPTQAEVTSAKTLGWKLLTVAGTGAAVRKFDTARVNFWLQGVKAGQNIKGYQLINGVWAFVEMPAPVAEAAAAE